MDTSHPTTRSRRHATWLAALTSITLLTFGRPAAAVDGCQLLLCLAAPSWRQIPQCVPTVVQALRDLSRGKPFPTCNMGGSSATSGNTWASAPSFCPPQYTLVSETESSPIYQCVYTGAISVSVDGALFSRTWWNMAGDSVTEFAPAAKAVLKTWDTRFDDDYAAWFSRLPPPPAEPAGGGL